MRRIAFALVATVVACAAQSPDEDGKAGALRPLERKLIGPAQPYEADATLRDKTEALRASQSGRRAVAWHSLAKVLKPVGVADKNAKVGSTPVKLPLFRTWYGRDDFERMFAKAYGDKTPEARLAREPIGSEEIDRVFAWNATDQGSFSDGDYLERVKQLSDKELAQGLGGNSRVSYSPGFVRHMLGDYATGQACLPTIGDVDPLAEPKDQKNFAPCMSSEFPIDAAIAKASWWRADFGLKLPVHDTSAASIKARKAGTQGEGGWGPGESEASPDASHVYTVKTSDGSTFRMAGFHLVTKEIREWMWITMWYSPDPNSDFGADRPAEITALGAPWNNYKMCVVVGYDENDPDPRGGYAGSLGDALAAAWDGKGAPTWCTNNYLEKGAHNAQTNCVGCHQHAGTPGLSSQAILGNPVAFPQSARTKLRKNFIADYTWAFDFPPEQLSRLVERQVAHFDTIDR